MKEVPHFHKNSVAKIYNTSLSIISDSRMEISSNFIQITEDVQITNWKHDCEDRKVSLTIFSFNVHG